MGGALGKLVPLILTFIFVGIVAWVGYQMYIFSNELADRGKKHMEKKNINFTKDGMRVGVKHRTEEEQADKQQSFLVKTWNLTNFPNYKSMWNTPAQNGAQEERPSASRTSSSASRPSASRTSSAASRPAASRHSTTATVR